MSIFCPHSRPQHRSLTAHREVSKFGYTGEQGPFNWAGLDPANSACSPGKPQSPIVLDDPIQKAASAPVVTIESVEEAEFENLGTTLEVVMTGTTSFEGPVDYTLQQFYEYPASIVSTMNTSRWRCIWLMRAYETAGKSSCVYHIMIVAH